MPNPSQATRIGHFKQIFPKNQILKVGLPFHEIFLILWPNEPHGYLEQVHWSAENADLDWSPFSNVAFEGKCAFNKYIPCHFLDLTFQSLHLLPCNPVLIHSFDILTGCFLDSSQDSWVGNQNIPSDF